MKRWERVSHLPAERVSRRLFWDPLPAILLPVALPGGASLPPRGLFAHEPNRFGVPCRTWELVRREGRPFYYIRSQPAGYIRPYPCGHCRGLFELVRQGVVLSFLRYCPASGEAGVGPGKEARDG